MKMKATTRNLKALSLASDDPYVKNVIGRVCKPLFLHRTTVDERVEELKTLRDHPEFLMSYALYIKRGSQISEAADSVIQQVTNQNGVPIW